jgi:hypothetical protein
MSVSYARWDKRKRERLLSYHQMRAQWERRTPPESQKVALNDAHT